MQECTFKKHESQAALRLKSLQGEMRSRWGRMEAFFSMKVQVQVQRKASFVIASPSDEGQG